MKNLATSKNDICLIAGSGLFVYEVANYLNNKNLLNQIVLINEKVKDIKNWIYTISYDTIYGKYDEKIFLKEDKLFVNNQQIHTSSEDKISDVPWKEYDVNYIIDCTGIKDNISQSRDFYSFFVNYYRKFRVIS